MLFGLVIQCTVTRLKLATGFKTRPFDSVIKEVKISLVFTKLKGLMQEDYMLK